MPKYVGDFNYYGQCFKFYTHANCFLKAFENFCRQLAEKVERSPGLIRLHFHKTGNYEIRTVS